MSGIGPIAIFDKSASQSLNPDEALWFDWLYKTSIAFLRRDARRPQQANARRPHAGAGCRQHCVQDTGHRLRAQRPPL